MRALPHAHPDAPGARPGCGALRHQTFLVSARDVGCRHPADHRLAAHHHALLGRSHAAVVQILGSPIVAIIMLLFIINTAYHMWIGMQEIILDYVHDDKWKFLSLMANTFFVFAVSLASVYAILKLSFGV